MKRNIILLIATLLAINVSSFAQRKDKDGFTITGPINDVSFRSIKRGRSNFTFFQSKTEGNAEMTVLSKRGSEKLSGKWSTIGNALIRESFQRNEENVEMSYTYNIKRMIGNVYHGGYGFWASGKRNQEKNIVEFYVVEGYNDLSNVIFGMKKTDIKYKSNGSEYEVYYDPKNQGTVYQEGIDLPFLQIKIVRTTSKGKRQKSGKIIWRDHFNQLRKKHRSNRNHRIFRQFLPRNIFEVSYLFEGFGRLEDDGGTSTVDFDLDARFSVKSSKELSEVSNSETTIYPNPTSGEFTVEGNTEEETTISIYNLNGSLVAETITNEPATNFNADGALASGIYIVKITNGTITTTEKLVVQ